ncbi:hypothetical protein D9C73_002083 [Collichthys lucidus]|uniref:Uncharacterized protein n=1 Tax=Collichthys lucidus TaxID=240159 RepID=A0A4U5U1T9_COLLU|nr:hypothetical protein D9C73_002083 [Collichthys lucidus]
MIKVWQVAVERSAVVVPGKEAAVSGVASPGVVYLRRASQQQLLSARHSSAEAPRLQQFELPADLGSQVLLSLCFILAAHMQLDQDGKHKEGIQNQIDLKASYQLKL